MLTINIYLQIVNFSKKINGSPDPSIICCSEIIVPENNPTGSENPEAPVNISPSRQKVVTRIDLNQIRVHAPLAQQHQGRPA